MGAKIETKNKDQLPKDWKWVKLGEVCDKISLNKIKIKQKDYLEEGVYPVVDQGQELIGGYYNDKRLLIPNEPPYIIFGDHTKAKKFINFKFIAGADGVKVLKARDIIDSKFLYYSLFTVKIEDKGYARHFQLIEKELFPLPPKPTQQAIVSKIEELFSELDKGIENLRLAQQQLKTYRQSVLKWAFEGKLTKSLNHDSYDLYDEHDLIMAAESEAVYKAKKNQGNQNNHINHSSDKGELPEGWKWVKSGDFFDFVTSGSRGWAKYYSDKGAIFIRITNLDFDSLELDLAETKIQYVNPPSSSEGIRTKVQEGDFLFSITGYLGMLAIAPKFDNAYVNQHVCLCRPNNNFNKKYLGYWIVSKSGGHHYLNKNQKGAVKAGLNLDDLKTFPVPLCSIGEQHNIVQAIESRLSVADKMEESITQSLQQAEALRQSILKKAFEGRLV